VILTLAATYHKLQFRNKHTCTVQTAVAFQGKLLSMGTRFNLHIKFHQHTYIAVKIYKLVM